MSELVKRKDRRSDVGYHCYYCCDSGDTSYGSERRGFCAILICGAPQRAKETLGRKKVEGF